jgi:hypothetical protein
MFRISWRYLATGITGHGSYVFHTYADAIAIAEVYNRRHHDMIHYVEEQPEGEKNISGAGAN